MSQRVDSIVLGKSIVYTVDANESKQLPAIKYYARATVSGRKEFYTNDLNKFYESLSFAFKSLN